MAIAKQECKCYHCKITIKAGDKAEWLVRSVSGGQHLVKNYTRYSMVCSDSKACGERRGNAYLSKEAAHKQKEAQDMVDEMRKGVSGIFGMEYPQDIIARIVAKYAAEGITVQ